MAPGQFHGDGASHRRSDQPDGLIAGEFVQECREVSEHRLRTDSSTRMTGAEPEAVKIRHHQSVGLLQQRHEAAELKMAAVESVQEQHHRAITVLNNWIEIVCRGIQLPPLQALM
jgi:phage/plasmid primase-like uncharacterized protein